MKTICPVTARRALPHTLHHRPCARLAALALLLGGTGPARAGVALYTQGSAAGHFDVVFSNGPQSGAEDTNQQVAARFTLSSSAVVDSLQWFGKWYTNPPRDPGDGEGSFLLRLYTSASGAPGTLLCEQAADITGVNAGTSGFSYSAAFNPGTLTAGTVYWLSIVENDPDSSAAGWGWSAFNDPDHTTWNRFGEAAPWRGAGRGRGWISPSPARWCRSPPARRCAGSARPGCWRAATAGPAGIRSEAGDFPPPDGRSVTRRPSVGRVTGSGPRHTPRRGAASGRTLR